MEKIRLVKQMINKKKKTVYFRIKRVKKVKLSAKICSKVLIFLIFMIELGKY